MPLIRYGSGVGGGSFGGSTLGNMASFPASRTGERTEDETAKDIQKDLKYLESIRANYEPMIDNILTFVDHSRRLITDKDLQPGQKTGREVYDSSAIGAVSIAVDGTVGNLCSRNMAWFQFGIPGIYNFPRASGMRQWTGKRIDSYPDVKRWLQDCQDVQYFALTRSNWYDINTQFVRDGMVPGTSHLISEEDVGSGRINFTVPHFRECFIAENRFGHVDVNFRVYKMTLRQLVDQFGWERMNEIDQSFRQAYEANYHSEKKIIHAIYPRKDRDPNRDDGKNKPIASMWVLSEPLKLIKETGYYWMPTITWRWRKNNDEWYGRSPAWDSFVEIVKANQQGRSNLIAAQKAVEPPIVAYSDLRGKINRGPNAVTYIENTFGHGGTIKERAPMPLYTGIQLPVAMDMQERSQRIIENNFAVPFFMALTQAAQMKVELTATQVFEMMGEKATVLCTRIGMLESEGLDPMMDRVFEIEARAGRMPQPPGILQELMGAQMEVQYTGPLARLQMRLSKMRSIQSGIGIATQIASVSPEAAELVSTKVNWLKTVEEIFDATGFPQSCLNSDEDVAKIMQAKLKTQQQQQQVENLTPISKALRAGAVKPEKGSPAQELIHPEQTEGQPVGA